MSTPRDSDERSDSTTEGSLDGLEDVRRSALTAAAVWTGLHVLIGVAYADLVTRPTTYWSALALLALGSAIGTRPLWDRAAEARRETVLALVSVVVLVPVVALMVAVSSETPGTTGYPSWVAGASGVMLAALVLRGGLWWGEAAAAAMFVVQALLHGTGLGPVSLPQAIMLAAPAQLWVVGTWVAGRFLRRTADLASGFRTRSAIESAKREAADSWSEMRRRRLADLEGEVLPLIREVIDLAPGATVPESLRSRSRELAAALRDSLLTRSLMVPELRASVRDARHRGVVVMLNSELFHGQRVTSLREALQGLLDVPGLSSITVRAFSKRPGQPAETTMILGGSLRDLDVEPHLRGLSGDGGWERVDLVPLGEELMVRLHGPR